MKDTFPVTAAVFTVVYGLYMIWGQLTRIAEALESMVG